MNNTTTRLLTLSLVTLLLVGCEAKRITIELDPRDTQNVPQDRKTVYLKDYQDLFIEGTRNNKWVVYKPKSAEYNAEFQARKADCTNDALRGVNAFFTLITLGIVPYYSSCDIDLDLRLKNTSDGYESAEHVGTLTFTDWIGWAALFIPNKVAGENEQYLTQHIAYQLYNPKSGLYQEKTVSDYKKWEQEQQEEWERAMMLHGEISPEEVDEINLAARKKEQESAAAKQLDADISKMLNDLK